jgi:glycosyltransferase involved in cell wall biosynthesis
MGLIPTAAKRYIRSAFENASAIISVSKGLSHAMKPYSGNRQIIIVPNVVDTDYFSLPSVRSLPPPFVFLGIAHLVERKGFHILINAFARKFKNNRNVRLEIGGDGPQRQKLEALCKRLYVEDKVSFLGALSREQVREAMWRVHAFVLPSFHETFGVVIIEAMSTGLPIIATRSGGPEDIVNSDIGLLIKPGDEEELANAMQCVLESNRFSYEAIHNYTVSRYGELAIASSLGDIYQHILQERLPA